MVIKSPVHRKQFTIHRPRRVSFCHKASHNKEHCSFIVIDDCFYLSVFFLGLCWELIGCPPQIGNCRVQCEFLSFVCMDCWACTPGMSRHTKIGAVRYAIFWRICLNFRSPQMFARDWRLAEFGPLHFTLQWSVCERQTRSQFLFYSLTFPRVCDLTYTPWDASVFWTKYFSCHTFTALYFFHRYVSLQLPVRYPNH